MKQLQPYDTGHLLRGINWMSRRLEQLNQALIPITAHEYIGKIRVRASVNVSHHGLATMAMYAIRQSRSAGTAVPTGSDIARLSSNLYVIEDKWVRNRHEDEPLMALVRVANAQFPYQETFGHLIPRYIALFEAKPKTPPIDIDAAFLKRTGLQINEFIAIGFMFYSALSLNNGIGMDYFKKSQLQQSNLKPLLTDEKLQSFLMMTSLRMDEFRERRYKEEREADDNGPYVFNPLVSFPLIRMGGGIVSAPVPRLIIHRVSKGIYYDLLDAFSNPPHHNPFTEWFGFALEEYIGNLLTAVFGSERVFHETSYGGKLPTPDWVGVDGELAIALESRSSRLPKLMKTTAHSIEVKARIKEAITEPASKLRSKVESLKALETPLPVAAVHEFLPTIVTLEEWYPNALTASFVRANLVDNGIADFSPEIMSVADLEWLLAWQQIESPLATLREKISTESAKEMSIGQFLAKRAAGKGVKFPRSQVLGQKFDSFFQANGFPSQDDAVSATKGDLNVEDDAKNGDAPIPG